MATIETFTKRMRRETRDVHKISDALINAKLAFGKFLNLTAVQLILSNAHHFLHTQHCPIMVFGPMDYSFSMKYSDF